MRARKDTINVAKLCCYGLISHTRVLISPQPDQEGNKLGSMSGTRAISTTSRRELSSKFFFLQGKAPKEIHAILIETLSCFLPGRAKDLSAPLYTSARGTATDLLRPLQYAVLEITNHIPYIGSP